MYVTAKQSKKKIMLSFECDTEKEALTVFDNLVSNDYNYQAVTIRQTSPFVRGGKVERYTKTTMPSMYRKD